MPVEKRNGYRVIVGGPVPPQAEAITLGNTIIVRKRSCDHKGLMAHELVHVRQFGELGPLRFLVRYVGSYLRFRLGGYGHMAAYRRIPLEVEASWVSRLHPMQELEPGNDHGDVVVPTVSKNSAVVLRDRLNRQRTRLEASTRPASSGGVWGRSEPPSDLAVVKAAMAPRDANGATSR